MMEIFGYKIKEILEFAVAAQGEIVDGCALYDADLGRIVGGSYTTGTVENPKNHLIEIIRLPMGEIRASDMECDDCPYAVGTDAHDNCCLDAFVDEFDEVDFDMESIEKQVRELIIEDIDDELDKIQFIRSTLMGLNSIEVMEWRLKTLDYIVDCAIENQFKLGLDFLEAERVNLTLTYEYSDNATFREVASLINNGDLDGAIELLQ